MSRKFSFAYQLWENDLRFLPPLIIEKSHIDEMSEKLRKVFKSFE